MKISIYVFEIAGDCNKWEGCSARIISVGSEIIFICNYWDTLVFYWKAVFPHGPLLLLWEADHIGVERDRGPLSVEAEEQILSER